MENSRIGHFINKCYMLPLKKKSKF